MESLPLSRAEFDEIYGKVPRLTVELVIRSDKGLLLAKRGIEPCQGQWHLPGGTVFFGEALDAAARRVAMNELGVTVAVGAQLGVIQYPRMLAEGYQGWPVGIAFDTTVVDGEPGRSRQVDQAAYFTSLPENTIADQIVFLNAIGYQQGP